MGGGSLHLDIHRQFRFQHWMCELDHAIRVIPASRSRESRGHGNFCQLAVEFHRRPDHAEDAALHSVRHLLLLFRFLRGTLLLGALCSTRDKGYVHPSRCACLHANNLGIPIEEMDKVFGGTTGGDDVRRIVEIRGRLECEQDSMALDDVSGPKFLMVEERIERNSF